MVIPFPIMYTWNIVYNSVGGLEHEGCGDGYDAIDAAMSFCIRWDNCEEVVSAQQLFPVGDRNRVQCEILNP